MWIFFRNIFKIQHYGGNKPPTTRPRPEVTPGGRSLVCNACRSKLRFQAFFCHRCGERVRPKIGGENYEPVGPRPIPPPAPPKPRLQTQRS